MSWSLVEARALAQKAARGAGMHWGHAEEAGFAATWLEARGLSGIEALARYLENTVQSGGVKPNHCPIFQGSAISDCNDPSLLPALSLYQPILLLPFIAAASGTDTWRVTWGDKAFSTNASDIYPFDRTALSEQIESVGIEKSEAQLQINDCYPRVQADRKVFIEKLTKLAHRTYAPSTEESRAKGAGGAD